MQLTALVETVAWVACEMIGVTLGRARNTGIALETPCLIETGYALATRVTASVNEATGIVSTTGLTLRLLTTRVTG